MDVQGLAAVESIIAEVDAEGPATPEQQQQQQQAADAETQAREWGTIAYMIGGALSMIAPELRQVYTEDACLAWGHTVVPVAEKYGWGNPANVPEISLAIATVGFAVPSFLLVRKRLQQLKAEKQKGRAEPAAPAAAAVAEPSPVPADGVTHGS